MTPRSLPGAADSTAGRGARIPRSCAAARRGRRRHPFERPVRSPRPALTDRRPLHRMHLSLNGRAPGEPHTWPSPRTASPASRRSRSTPARSPPRARTPAPCRSTRRPPTRSTPRTTARRLFALQEFGNIYTRIMNPTTDVFEKRIAALEGGVAALATASGQAAQFLAIANLAQAGDNIVSTSLPLRRHLQPVQGDAPAPRHRREARRRRRPRRAPEGDRREDEGALRRVHRQPGRRTSPTSRRSRSSPTRTGIPLIVDNTFGAAGLPRAAPSSTAPTSSSSPPRSGSAATARRSAASSSTRASSTGARAASSRSSPSPSPGYHGLVFNDVFGPKGPVRQHPVHHPRPRRGAARPRAGALALQRLPLPPGARDALAARAAALRQRARARDAGSRRHPQVTWVNYPGLESHPHHQRARKYLPERVRRRLHLRHQGRLRGGQEVHRRA